jgi:hypothetical protein
MIENWLAVMPSTAATMTSPYSAGAMKWVMTSVPTRPIALEPMPEEIVHSAPRTESRTSDTTQGTRTESPARITMSCSGLLPDRMSS